MSVSFNVAELEAAPLDPKFALKKGDSEPCITLSPNPHNNLKDLAPVAGVDSFSVAVWAWFREGYFEELMAALEEHQKQAREIHKDVALDWRGITIQLSPSGTPTGGGMPFKFIVDGIYFALARNGKPGRKHNMIISVMGGVMMQHSWRIHSAWWAVRKIINALGADVSRHTLSRVDLFSDCVGLHVKKFQPIMKRGGFVSRCRWVGRFSGVDKHDIAEAVKKGFKRGFEAVVAELRKLWGQAELKTITEALTQVADGTFDLAEYGKTKEDLGYQFGKGASVCRIYNKVLQLEKCRHSERLKPMRDAWGVAADTPVTRVEFQLRSAPLRLRGIETIDDFQKSVPSLVHELTHEWIVGTKSYDGKNKDRREIHQVWKRVQANFLVGFRFRSEEHQARLDRVKPEPKDNGSQLARMSLGFITSAVARTVGPCESPWDLRATVIDQLDDAAGRVGGWEAIHPDQVNRAFRWQNSIGLPFSGKSNKAIMDALLGRLDAELNQEAESAVGASFVQKSILAGAN
ncbi:hypothetical protein [Planctomicrobium sp. SH527]|uniref:hypothetical protein n=1 Tax=Planctomicrobium sp. SH527 TaxID=3448123 RepID=UPI003F5CA227